jgi:hypothetical protein
MTSEERDIYHYLMTAPKAYFSSKEIARRAAGKKTFQESPQWAKPFLPRMVEKGVLEMDGAGHFRIKSKMETELKDRKWVAPHIARILKQSGKEFGAGTTIDLEAE